MSWGDGIRRRWLRFRRRRQAKKLSETPLREFVYLDEVSVYSLVASRKGPIATDYRDTASTLLRSEVEGRFGASAGVAKSEIGSLVESSQANEMQIVRKAVIQSTFRELYESEREKLALRVVDAGEAPDPPSNLEGVRAAIATQSRGGAWVVSPSDLTRGRMIEMEVELRADDVFGFTTAMSSILDMIEGNAELMSHINEQELRQVVDINGILQRLLVGLVPLLGRSIHYRSVTVDGQEWLLHASLLAQLPEAELPSRAVFLVGVAEQQLFWRDIRRVLFSRSRYLTLARLGKDGIQDEWSPVKSLGVLEDVIPGLAQPIADAIRSLPTMLAAHGGGAATDSLVSPAERFFSALVRYAVVIADRSGHKYEGAEEDLLEHRVIGDEQLTGLETYERRRDAFRSVANHVVAKFGIDLDPSMAAGLRHDVLVEARLWPPTASTFAGSSLVSADTSSSAAPSADSVDASPVRYLDAEVVAVYW